MSSKSPMPENELDRIMNLAEYDLDYLAMKEDFNGLAHLAAQVAGTRMSHINLIDAFNQWTIGDFGLPGSITPREETVCHYTIAQNEHFEITDLASDDRFREKKFVTRDPLLRYYYGVPLKSSGFNIGSLCVLDREVKQLSRDKGELLNVIANEVVRRLQTRRAINILKEKYDELKTNHKKLAHDIRGPVGGVMGLAQIINEQGEENTLSEVLELSSLMEKSCSSILELANDILSDIDQGITSGNTVSLKTFKEKLLELYTPLAKNKQITFTASISEEYETLEVPRARLFQISGNLISNAIKFTPEKGTVSVMLEAGISHTHTLIIKVKDSGIGLTADKITEIMDGGGKTTVGTHGEQGFGFGLALVKHLIEEMNGTFTISSVPGEGALFEVLLPLNSDIGISRK